MKKENINLIIFAFGCMLLFIVMIMIIANSTNTNDRQIENTIVQLENELIL